MKKKRKNCRKKYINGSKGVIALFLAVLMTPFLSIAMILVETGRYNSAVSILDEAMGVTSVSTLADYDKYLMERWGLLAVNQECDINSQYEYYLNTNSEVLGESLSINDVSAEGIYALNNSEILYNQILEFSKLNVPTKLAIDVSGISDLIKKLESLAQVGKYFNIIASGTDAVDSAITLAESAEDLKTTANKLDTLKIEYGTSYTAFKNAVEALKEAYKTERPTDETEAKEYDENIGRLKENLVDARDIYADVLKEIADNLQSYKEKMRACNSAIESIKSDIANIAVTTLQLENERKLKQQELKNVNQRIAEMEENGQNISQPALYTQALEEKSDLEGQIAEIATEEGLASAAQSGLSGASSSWTDSFNSYSDATIGELVNSFRSLETKIRNFDTELVTSEYVLDDNEYHRFSVAGYISAGDIDAYLNEQETELENGSLSALINGMISFYNSLCKLSLFYDPALSANIDSVYYEENFGGLPGQSSAEGGVMTIISAIGNMLSSMRGFAEDVVSLKWIDALKEIKNFIESVKSLGESIVQFAIDIGTNIKDLLTNYERLYYSTYVTYNLPCRTNYSSFKSMSGGSPSLPQTQQSIGVSLIDDLIALIDEIKVVSNGSGKDITFNGAELEYILFGSNSEIANQMYSFVTIYLFRLLFNLPIIMGNPEVQSLAASTTLGYPVVMVLEILVEPLIDTVLLVNDSTIPLVKAKVYLTPSGLPEVLQKLMPILSGMSQADKDKVGEELTSAFRVSQDDYKYQQTLMKHDSSVASSGKDILELQYEEYCLIILLLTVTREQQMARLSNLIQMESLYHYNEQGVSYTFDLSKAYTYIQSEANVSVKQMLPSLADSSLFKITRTQYRGY